MRRAGIQVGPELLACRGKYLDYDDVMRKYDATLDWLAHLYMNTLNVIHYMHDKYCYEKIQMALHDNDVFRTMAAGVAGLSVVCDHCPRSSTPGCARSVTRAGWQWILRWKAISRNSATTTIVWTR